MTYTFNRNILNNSTIRYAINSESGKLTYRDFINLLKAKDDNFLRTFRNELNSTEFPAYFWECVPVSNNTLDKDFEFVLVNSGALDNIRQDYSNFQEHFRKSSDNQVVSFSSFSGDTLIVPTPKNADYKNITKFANNASMEQWGEFWKKVGEKMEENLVNAGGSTRWLSTSGLAVHYLHVRVDKRPKYYNHQEYLAETKEYQEVPPKSSF